MDSYVATRHRLHRSIRRKLEKYLGTVIWRSPRKRFLAATAKVHPKQQQHQHKHRTQVQSLHPQRH